MLPGKKDCITMNMVKTQKRVLCETMTVVYSKFMNKFPRLAVLQNAALFGHHAHSSRQRDMSVHDPREHGTQDGDAARSQSSV